MTPRQGGAEPDRWHLDRSISISTLVSGLVMAFSFVVGGSIWISNVNAKLDQLGELVVVVGADRARTEARFDDLQKQVNGLYAASARDPSDQTHGRHK